MGREEKALERIVKGFANHRRIEMLRLLQKAPGLSLEDITLRLRINNKTGAEHLRRLALAGLVQKKYEGRRISVRISRRGERALASLPELLLRDCCCDRLHDRSHAAFAGLAYWITFLRK